MRITILACAAAVWLAGAQLASAQFGVPGGPGFGGLGGFDGPGYGLGGGYPYGYPGGGYPGGLGYGYGSFFSELVSQQVIPDPALDPARVALTNTAREPIVVWIFDKRTPGRGGEYRIPTGASVDVLLDRQPGGIVEQVYHVRRYDRVVEEVVSTPLRPKVLYTVVAFVERTQLSYRDPKGISGVPDYDEKNAVGIGVFDIPPGANLGSQVKLDVVREAAARRNPGAVSAFERPLPPLSDEERDDRAQAILGAQRARDDQPAARQPAVHTVPQFPQAPRQQRTVSQAEDVEDS